jgi:putative PIN family toxin of toxin-antitoxin system
VRAVLDTNVLASGTIDRDTAPSQIITRWLAGRYALVVSDPIIDEFQRVLDDVYFQRMSSPATVATILAGLRIVGLIVPLNPNVERVATHPEDDLILATAIAGAADYLVTGDRKLLALGTYQSVRIVSPAEFLALLDSETI